tara:strand:- start:145 stop:354 length:210 start_codon:yes stop_codon:yes gene_type:complete
MSIIQIIQNIKHIRSEYENGNINGDDMSEALEDLCIDIKDKSDHSEIFDNDDGYYETFEETDFTKMEIY